MGTRSCLINLPSFPTASEHGERATDRSAPAKRRAREHVGESEGRSPSVRLSARPDHGVVEVGEHARVELFDVGIERLGEVRKRDVGAVG